MAVIAQKLRALRLPYFFHRRARPGSSAARKVKPPMRSVFLLLLGALSPAALAAKEKPPTTYTIPLPPQADFSALQWLLGDWTGKTVDHEPPGDIRLSVTYGPEKRFIILNEETSIPATNAAPAVRESWMGILSARSSGGAFVLRVFSSTGFITRYRVSAEAAAIHFDPEGGEQPPPGWLFRRLINRTGDAEMTETVYVAPPEKPFFQYYSSKLVRESPRSQAAPALPVNPQKQ